MKIRDLIARSLRLFMRKFVSLAANDRWYKRCRYAFLFITLLCHLLISSCMPSREILLIDNSSLLEKVPSGSAITIVNDEMIIVGDDATSVYKLGLTGSDIRAIPIKGLQHQVLREAKAVKHDFEASAIIPWQGRQTLLAFGSGSIEDRRDSLLILDLDDTNQQQIISLKPFYRELRERSGTGSDQWNIEGAAVAGNELVLANRAGNMLIICNLASFMNYITAKEEFPATRFASLKLPQIGKYEARLSGIAAIDADTLLFSASVEQTPDWISDGPVLGSYLVKYSLVENKIIATALLADKNNKPIIEKLESIDLVKRTASGQLELVAISDNDDGRTRLMRIRW